MVRVAEGEDWLHVAAVAAPIELCNAALGGDDLLREVGLLSAPDLDVTLLHATTPAGEEAVSDEAIEDRKSVVEGMSVSVRVDLGGRRIMKKKTKTSNTTSRMCKLRLQPKL